MAALVRSETKVISVMQVLELEYHNYLTSPPTRKRHVYKSGGSRAAPLQLIKTKTLDIKELSGRFRGWVGRLGGGAAVVTVRVEGGRRSRNPSLRNLVVSDDAMPSWVIGGRGSVIVSTLDSPTS